MGMGNIATTGMQAAMSNMEVTSNNVANANTTGFKKSTANFVDIFPSGSGSSSGQIGLGVKLNSVKQSFTPGGPTETDLPTDLFINGNGFFIMSDSATGETTYTRAGQFQFNNGYFTVGNKRLQAFPAVNGSIPAGSTPADLFIDRAPISANASSVITANQLNLNSGDTAIAVPFNPNNSSTYNYTTTATVYDSLGNANPLSLYFVKTAANNWNVEVEMQGSNIGLGTLSFSTSGALTSATGLTGLSFNPTSGGVSPQTFDISMTGTTQLALSDSTNPFTTDGYQAGTYQGYVIDQNGNVNVQFSNKQTILAGQIAIANFQATEGLQDVGNMSWMATTDSGPASVNISNSTGNITQGSLEMSNVDLATELVNLISEQNTFQANAQVEQTYNQVMQTVTKL